MNELISIDQVEPQILLIRGHKAILDADLARLFGVATKRLNQQVNRNRERFPSDFMLTLTPSEKAELVATCNRFRNLKHSTTMPNAYTEHGVLMVASVLNTPIAVQASIQVVRAFVRIRTLLATHKELANRLTELEKRMGSQDVQIRSLFDAIRQLMNPSAPVEPRRRIGYRVNTGVAAVRQGGMR